MKYQKIAGFALSMLMLSACSGITAQAEDALPLELEINVSVPTQSEIRDYVAAHPFDRSAKTTYIKEPSDSSPGVMSEESRTNALNTLNVMRYICGLNEVTISEDYQEKAEAGAWLCRLNQTMSHSPEQPAGVPDELYEKGYAGANGSNLCQGSGRLSDIVLKGWFWDGGVASLGHRRWCQNPDFKTTGFGCDSIFTAMYVTGQGGINTSITGVSFPAQNMPVEYFGQGVEWSISLYTDSDVLNTSNVNVTLVRSSDNQTWHFSESASDGSFSVDNTSYLGRGFIIFTPDGIQEYQAGDSYTVTIESPAIANPLTYTVNFFSLDAPEEEYFAGDINKDGSVSVSDAVYLLKYLHGRQNLTEEQAGLADLNGDGTVNIYDLIYLKKVLIYG